MRINKNAMASLFRQVTDQAVELLQNHDDITREIEIESIGLKKYSDFRVTLNLSKDLFKAGSMGNYGLLQEPTDDEYTYFVDVISPVTCINKKDEEFEVEIDREGLINRIKNAIE